MTSTTTTATTTRKWIPKVNVAENEEKKQSNIRTKTTKTIKTGENTNTNAEPKTK